MKSTVGKTFDAIGVRRRGRQRRKRYESIIDNKKQRKVETYHIEDKESITAYVFKILKKQIEN